MLATTPAVFAVENNYQIFAKVEDECTFWVTVGDKDYYDDFNGLFRTLCKVHSVIVPMEELNKAKKYTIHVRPITERSFWKIMTGDIQDFTFDFIPVPDKNIRAYHISDTHGKAQIAIDAAKVFGDIDFLILNGDIVNHCSDPEEFDTVYSLCSELTGGKKPVVCSRGNHDLRGNYAEDFLRYVPNANGKTYYTFRLGTIWGLVLDCGEDKVDEYYSNYNMVCCHAFRLKQTEFIKEVVKNKEYLDEGIKTRIVVCHNPFTNIMEEPFDIEQDIYDEWVRMLREDIKPNVIICGHMHIVDVWEQGSEHDCHNQPCPTVIGGDLKFQEDYFAGCGYTFNGDKIDIAFTDNAGKVLATRTL